MLFIKFYVKVILARLVLPIKPLAVTGDRDSESRQPAVKRRERSVDSSHKQAFQVVRHVSYSLLILMQSSESVRVASSGFFQIISRFTTAL